MAEDKNRDYWVVLGRPIRDFKRLRIHTVTLNKTTGEIGINSVNVFGLGEELQQRARLSSFESMDLPELVKRHIRKFSSVIKAKSAGD